MADTQRLADQLGWCITTKDYLNNLDNELRHIASQYQHTVDELKQHGYMADLLPRIEQLNETFQNETQALIRYVEEEHLAYIDKQSRSIGETLEALGI